MKKNTPFFAKFLENQQPEPESEQTVGGIATLKFPSDGDEAVTLKAPSDSEDITKLVFDVATTQKYPSDGDDNINPGEL
jgi:Serine endopeptidase inhibitors